MGRMIKNVNNIICAISVTYFCLYRMLFVPINNLVKYGNDNIWKMILNVILVFFCFDVFWLITMIHNEIDVLIERRFKLNE